MGCGQNLPLGVAATAPLSAGSLAPDIATNTGAANVTWLTVLTLAPLAFAAVILLTPLTLAIICSAFLSLPQTMPLILTLNLLWAE